MDKQGFNTFRIRELSKIELLKVQAKFNIRRKDAFLIKIV